MARKIRCSAVAAVLFAALVGALGASREGESAETSWAIRDLGTLGGAESVALALNERGEVAGWSETRSGVKHLFLWKKGRMRDLGVSVSPYSPIVMNNHGQIAGSRTNLPGFVWHDGTVRALKAPGHRVTQPTAINESGQVTGYQPRSGKPFLWQKGRLRFLPMLPGYRRMIPVAVNGRGQIVGAAWQSRPHAVEWDVDGRLVDLGSVYTAARPSRALAINQRGQVVGSITDDPDQDRAALWSHDKLTKLPPLRTSDAYRALDINRSGLILGFSYPIGPGEPQNARALVWKNMRVQNLGTLVPNCDDACDTTPHDLNDAGQVVGLTRLRPGIDHGFVWQGGHMYDLGALPARGASSEATGINGHNQIIGTSTVAGKRHAVLWSRKP